MVVILLTCYQNLQVFELFLLFYFWTKNGLVEFDIFTSLYEKDL